MLKFYKYRRNSLTFTKNLCIQRQPYEGRTEIYYYNWLFHDKGKVGRIKYIMGKVIQGRVPEM